MKRVLIVSPHFPPANAPDMQRVRMSLPFYHSHGWDPTVLTVGAAWQGGVPEPDLLLTIPKGVKIIRVPAIPLKWSRRFGLGNIGLRAWPFLYWHGARLLKQKKFDLVLFSTTQFVTFVLGPLWKAHFSVPYVLDFQDPWSTNAYELAGARPPPGGWKYQLARLQARIFEGWTVREAAGIMSVSPRYLEDLTERHPKFAGRPTAVLPFGASQADLDRARLLATPTHTFIRRSGERNLLYTGASGPIAPHTLRILFACLRAYKEQSPERASKIKLRFIGTSYAAEGQARATILPMAESFGLRDQVEEVPCRIGYLEAIALQQEADGLLLLGGSDPAYVPSKVFIYYLTAKPILALVYSATVLEQLLRELSCAYLVKTNPNAAPESAGPELFAFFDRLIDGELPALMPPRREEEFRTNFLAEGLVGRQCALFEAAVTEHKS